MHTDRLCRAQERAKVLRVIQRVKQQDERLFVPGAGVLENIKDIAVGVFPHFRGHALVILVNFVQPAPLHFFNRNPELVCHAQDLGETTLFLRPFGN